MKQAGGCSQTMEEEEEEGGMREGGGSQSSNQSDDQSVHQSGLRGAAETATLAELHTQTPTHKHTTAAAATVGKCFFSRQMQSDGLSRPLHTMHFTVARGLRVVVVVGRGRGRRWWEGLQEAVAAAPVRENTSTLLLERTKIFRSLIFISL